MRLFVIAILALGGNPAHQPGPHGTDLNISLAQPAARESSFAAPSNSRTSVNWHVAQNGDDSAKSPSAAATAQTASAKAGKVDSICQRLITAAQTNGLPVDFLARLIWQESRFRSDAISPAGAKGVAQFMPATAKGVGLADPFDAANAITKSAELLRNLRGQFGNWGLAAAAYNAGPKRVQDWLAGRRTLPPETRAYVSIVTGRTAESWRASEQGSPVANLSDKGSCPQLLTPLIEKSYASLNVEKPVLRTSSPGSAPPWGIQLLGDRSQPAVLAAYHRLQTRFRTVLGNRQPLVIRSAIGRVGYWYRVRVAANSLPEAERLCANLRILGGTCLVQRNN